MVLLTSLPSSQDCSISPWRLFSEINITDNHHSVLRIVLLLPPKVCYLISFVVLDCSGKSSLSGDLSSSHKGSFVEPAYVVPQISLNTLKSSNGAAWPKLRAHNMSDNLSISRCIIPRVPNSPRATDQYFRAMSSG